MTNFFGIDMTEGRGQPKTKNAPFITRTLPPDLEAQLDAMQERELALEAEIASKRSGGCALIMIRSFALMVWLCIIFMALQSDFGVVEDYHEVPGLYWTGAAAFLVWLGLFLFERLRPKSDAETDIRLADYVEDSNALRLKLHEALGTPEEVGQLDVLGEAYVIKNGVPKHRNLGVDDYRNLDMTVFVRDGSLCLVNLPMLWEIPLASIRRMMLVKKRVGFSGWNKPQAFDSPEYRPYKIAQFSTGQYLSTYYRVEIEDVRGSFYLMIPKHDGGVFTELTGIRPEQEGTQ